MMKVRNLGRKSLEEVLAKLKELGLQLQPTEELSAIEQGIPSAYKLQWGAKAVIQ